MDIGAHRGRHTVPMAQCVGEGGKVWAFEPLPGIRAELEQAVGASSGGLGHVEIRPEALSETAAESSFVFVSNWPEYSGLRERTYDAPAELQRIPVTAARLDDVLGDASPIRLIKIDAEGGEYHALRGAQQRLRRDRPLVLFEFGDNAISGYSDVSSRKMAQLLVGHGFALLDIRGRPLDVEAFVVSSAEQSVWDYAAVPAERSELLARVQSTLSRA
ncbi:MAG: FkbM family methyltransferase [Acidobacteriota bacterium]